MATLPNELYDFDAQLAQQTSAALASPSIADKEAVLAELPDSFEHKSATGNCEGHAQVNNFAEQLALKLRGDTVHSVLFGLAGVGKSTVFNFINYVLRGAKFAGGRQTGESAVAGGHFSQQCLRERASVHLGWDVKEKGDLLITDTVGFKGDEGELFAIGNGKLKEIEAWPRDDSEASVLKRFEILTRPAQTIRPTCFVFFISSDQLMNDNDKATGDIVKSVIDAAKTKFTAGEFQVEIPLMIVVTKVDKIESNPTNEDLLLQRTSPKLSTIFKKCQDHFGVCKDDMFALGFLNETDVIDFSPQSQDPRVLTIRHLVLRMAESAQICATRFKNLEQQTSSCSSAANPNVAHRDGSEPSDEFDRESVVSTQMAQMEQEPFSGNDYFDELMSVRGQLLTVQTQIVEQRMQFKSFLEAYLAAQPPKKAVKKHHVFRTKVR